MALNRTGSKDKTKSKEAEPKLKILKPVGMKRVWMHL